MRQSGPILVAKQDAGKRLDVFLAGSLDVSRGYAQRLLGRGTIRVEGHPAAKGTLLRAGDRIEVPPFRHPDEGPLASADVPLHVLRVEAGLLAVDKPAGLPTHPLDFDESRTLLNGVLARFPEARGVGEGGLSSGVVHRLDVQTSGVLLFATREDSWQRARSAFDQRRVDKRYVARVHGIFTTERTLKLRLAPRGDHVRVVETGGREAITSLRSLRQLEDSTLVEVRPATGLRHQIRATLAHLGHPVLGDRLYGSPLDLGRHWLHASFISLEGFEAASEVPASFSAPPSDLAEAEF